MALDGRDGDLVLQASRLQLDRRADVLLSHDRTGPHASQTLFHGPGIHASAWTERGAMSTHTVAEATRSLVQPGEPRVSIIILNFNTRDDLRTCLRSVRQTEAGEGRGDAEVFVVDNASTDGSADMVVEEFPWVRLIRAAKNGGYAYGNNLVMREC